MPRHSTSGNVRKLCGCVKWKDCAHPWYVDFQSGKDRYRRNLDVLMEEHAKDFEMAKTWARRAIVAWQEGGDPKALQPGDKPTLAELLEEFRKRPGAGKLEKIQAGPIERAIVGGSKFGLCPAEEITRPMLEEFRRQRPKIAGNRDLALLRAMFNWAVLGGLVPETPFKVGTVAAVRLVREEARTRRLEPGEEARLLAACQPGKDARGRTWRGNPGLEALIVGALETGCRLGELLSLQWHQVRGDLFLPGGKTKSKKPRRVPVSSRLREVLDGRRNDPAGEPLPADTYVFGDEVGRRRGTIKTAWRLVCKRAKIDGLHFHDLRRESGSRWMDAGVPLATIQRWLGHHNVSQTSTYLAATGGGDEAAMKAYEIAIGRLTFVDVSDGSDGSDTTSTDNGATETTNESAVLH